MEPWLRDLRAEGKLKHGKLPLFINTFSFEGKKKVVDKTNFSYWDKERKYEGEIDENGLACGYGVASCKDKRYKGCFVNDLFEGLGKSNIALGY